MWPLTRERWIESVDKNLEFFFKVYVTISWRIAGKIDEFPWDWFINWISVEENESRFRWMFSVPIDGKPLTYVNFCASPSKCKNFHEISTNQTCRRKLSERTRRIRWKASWKVWRKMSTQFFSSRTPLSSVVRRFSAILIHSRSFNHLFHYFFNSLRVIFFLLDSFKKFSLVYFFLVLPSSKILFLIFIHVLRLTLVHLLPSDAVRICLSRGWFYQIEKRHQHNDEKHFGCLWVTF